MEPKKKCTGCGKEFSPPEKTKNRMRYTHCKECVRKYDVYNAGIQVLKSLEHLWELIHEKLV